MEFKHVSVLLNECIEGLAVKPDGIYVDGTLGEPDMPFMYVKNCRKKDSLSGLIRTKRRFGLRQSVCSHLEIVSTLFEAIMST